MPSRPSAEPPEFFFDRSLGRNTAYRLRELGWSVHLVGDHFPNDGQHTSDEEWIGYGILRGWSLLAKDKRIRYVSRERGALIEGSLFVLSNGNLQIADQVNCFHNSQERIYRAAAQQQVAIYMVYANDIKLQWRRDGGPTA